MNVAQEETPAQSWISNWVDFLSENLPVIFLIVVLIVAIMLVAKAQTGVGKVIGFGIGVALIFLFVTNVELVSEFFREELPLDSEPGSLTPGP